MVASGNIKPIPEPTLRRMPTYLHYLKAINANNVASVSGPQIAKALKLDATQVVKDLVHTSVAGRTKVGYDVKELILAIEDFLGFNRANEAFLVGAGRLGSAIMGYAGFKDIGIKIIAAFDVNPSIVGSKIEEVYVLHTDKFADLAQRMHVQIGVITTPADVAQQVADIMVEAGIKAIWNFSPVVIQVPEPIIIQNTTMYSSLAVLLMRLNEQKNQSL